MPWSSEPDPRWEPGSSTLLLREVPAHLGAAPALLRSPLLVALREVPAARCRLYVLADVAAPAAAPPVAAALVEVGEPASGRSALLRALAVEPGHRRRGLGRRLLADVLTELRADGVRALRCRADPGLAGLLERAGFTVTSHAASEYDVPDIRHRALWLVREL
ncbi:GNAT family N-acetyltransferase [Nonomuraea pusilla]|uniref:GNAT family N-acetyltransferase n=1 Tax=Nonomuraea pusilla TaxID=46177 RepID=UPI0033169A5A